MAGRPPMGPSGAASAEGKISNTSLAEAVANGQVGVVKFLCEESKVDIDEPGKDGTTPICAAALWGNDQIVTYLLDKGGNIDAPNKGQPRLAVRRHLAAPRPARRCVSSTRAPLPHPHPAAARHPHSPLVQRLPGPRCTRRRSKSTGRW